MLYVNGDSHVAGAELIKDYCFAHDDPKYISYGRRAHPEAILKTFGYKVARTLNTGIMMDAESASSNDRIMRTTRHFVENTQDSSIVTLLVGWTSWEREEWFLDHQRDPIQVTASGLDSVPEELQDRYMEYVVSQDMETYRLKKQAWHKKIYEFHKELQDRGVRHLFFHTMDAWDYEGEDQCYDWGNNFMGAYNQQKSFTGFSKDGKFEPANPRSQHWGVDAHSAYYGLLWEKLMAILGENKTLTGNQKPSIVTKAKVKKFTGFNR